MREKSERGSRKAVGISGQRLVASPIEKQRICNLCLLSPCPPHPPAST